VGGSIGVAPAPTVAAASFERGAIGGFTDAFVGCAVAAAVNAAVALGLVPRGKPQMTVVGLGQVGMGVGMSRWQVGRAPAQMARSVCSSQMTW